MDRVESQHPEVSNRVGDTPQGRSPLKRWPEIGYILPFATFITFLAIQKVIPVPQPFRFLFILGLLGVVSRGLLPKKPSQLIPSALLGVAVFFIWIGPDVLIPGYRHSILFSNSIVG